MKVLMLLVLLLSGLMTSAQVNNPGTQPTGCGVNNPNAQSVGCGVQSAGTIQPGSPGFLPTTGVTNNITNLALQSQALATTPWTPVGVTAVAPTVTNNAAVAPDSTTTATGITMPTVVVTGSRSFVYQQFDGLTAPGPYTCSGYAKGAVGNEDFWMVTSNQFFTGVHIHTTTAWQRFQFTWVNQTSTNYLEIGTDLVDPHQSMTNAQTIYLWGVQCVVGQYPGFYIPTTTVAVTASQTTPLPANIAFRDFTTLTAFSSGAAITSPSGSTYKATGVAAPRVRTSGKIGATYYAPLACNSLAGTWNGICIYNSTNLTAWTDPGATINAAITNTASTWKDHYLLHPTLSPSCSIDTYCLYYSATTSGGNHPSIGLAHSADMQHWTDYGSNPVINDTTAGALGQLTQNMLPSVIQIGSTLYLYAATGCVANCSNFIVYWTSPASDGINWTYGGVALSPPGSGDWNVGKGIIDPMVFQNSHGFYEMVYTSNGNFPNGNLQQIGYAISADGVNFYNYQAAPLLKTGTTAFPGTLPVVITYIGDALLYSDGTTFYVYSDAADSPVTGNWGYVATMVDH